ncbi:MAG: glycoside hydrolase family 97 protein [Bacteroidales bacterium]|nr:glycoside hydrolase family 97 protein [Bacteroidales bacterium]
MNNPLYAFLKQILLIIIIICSHHLFAGEEYRLSSPDGRTVIKISIKEDIQFTVTKNDEEIISSSVISMTLDDIGVLGDNAEVEKAIRKTIQQEHFPVVRQKSKEIYEHCNELIIHFLGNFSLTFRAYNEGVAYRFTTKFNENIKVEAETFTINLPRNNFIYFPEEESFFSHNEREYKYQLVGDIPTGDFCTLPLLIEASYGIKILITESDLNEYPGMWFLANGNYSLSAIFPGYPVKTKQTGDRDVEVTEYADYLAKTGGSRTFPWRIIAIADSDGELITNQLTWMLASPLQINDPSWIRPGKVAWDWWNSNNIYDVDFRAGINTETYKYYIDFASNYGIEYIILDEGWYELGDLFDVNPDIDIEGLISYGKEKNVGIILWVIWKTLDDQLVEAMDLFEKWGVSGLKVDFMQRDDQEMVEYYHKIAHEAAKRKMLVDFHGAYKPSGLRRAYPNVLTREGLRGLEWNKWSNVITPEHDVTLPFIRMVAGPMDYTPGAMVNAQNDNFHAIFSRPMSQGTRCHQLAMYVVYESPLQMLADNPSNYLGEPVCMEFLSAVPVEWDETRVLKAKVADYIIVARRDGKEWYIGGMTDWSPRDFKIDLSFLPEGDYSIEIWQDGVNADRFAEDLKKTVKKVTNTDHLKIKMAQGGGYAARIYPAE